MTDYSKKIYSGFILIAVLFAFSDSKALADSCMYNVAQGISEEQQGKLERAKESYEKAVKEDRKCLAGYLHLADIYLAHKEYKKAEKVLYKAQRLDGNNNLIKLRLAECYFVNKKFAWALRSLQAVDKHKLQIDEEYLTYLFGRIAFEMGDYNSSIEYFSSIEKSFVTKTAEIEYFLAISYAKNGDTEKSRYYISRYLKSKNKKQNYIENAEKILDKTYELENYLPIVEVSLALALRYNTNVIQDPDDPIHKSNREPSSLGLGIDASINVNPLRKPRHHLGLNAYYSSTIYFSDPADDFTIFSGIFLPEYNYSFHAGGFDQQFSVAYQGSVSILLGGPMAEEDDAYVYSESHGGLLRWSMDEKDVGSTSVRFGFSKNMFHHMVRDNWGETLNIGQSFFFLNQKLKLYLQALGRYENAMKDAYDRWGAGGFFGVTGLLPHDINCSTWLKYEHLDHYNSENETLWQGYRKDESIKSSFSISRNVFKNYIDIGLSYSITKNISTIEDFQYIRHLLSLKITGRYEW